MAFDRTASERLRLIIALSSDTRIRAVCTDYPVGSSAPRPVLLNRPIRCPPSVRCTRRSHWCRSGLRSPLQIVD